MPHLTIRKLLLRELRALRREVEAYPDDAALWQVPRGTTNSGGTLVLHLTGNLQHYVGAVLGRTGYVRERDAEFARTGLPRSELVEEIEATARAVDASLMKLDPQQLSADFPVAVSGRTLSTRDFLAHLASHLAYHLGQIDYHRRITTEGARAVGTMSLAEFAATDE